MKVLYKPASQIPLFWRLMLEQRAWLRTSWVEMSDRDLKTPFAHYYSVSLFQHHLANQKARRLSTSI